MTTIPPAIEHVRLVLQDSGSSVSRSGMIGRALPAQGVRGDRRRWILTGLVSRTGIAPSPRRSAPAGTSGVGVVYDDAEPRAPASFPCVNQAAESTSAVFLVQRPICVRATCSIGIGNRQPLKLPDKRIANSSNTAARLTFWPVRSAEHHPAECEPARRPRLAAQRLCLTEAGAQLVGLERQPGPRAARKMPRRAMLPTQTAAAIEKVAANAMISHMAPAAKLRRGSMSQRFGGACRVMAGSLMPLR